MNSLAFCRVEGSVFGVTLDAAAISFISSEIKSITRWREKRLIYVL
jgi:hypothetical protein